MPAGLGIIVTVVLMVILGLVIQWERPKTRKEAGAIAAPCRMPAVDPSGQPVGVERLPAEPGSAFAAAERQLEWDSSGRDMYCPHLDAGTAIDTIPLLNVERSMTDEQLDAMKIEGMTDQVPAAYDSGLMQQAADYADTAAVLGLTRQQAASRYSPYPSLQ